MQTSIQDLVSQTLHSIISQVDDAYHSQDLSKDNTTSHDILNLPFESTKCSLQDVQVEVIECYKQINSDICGFHCLFNLLQFLNYTLENNTLNKNIINGAEFWKCYEEIYKYLMNNYPNKNELKELQNLGPLDRVHMEYFLQHNEKIKDITKLLQDKYDYKLFIQPFYFGFGIIQNSEDELNQFQDFAIQLDKNQANAILVFPLGVTIHWSLLVIIVSKGSKRYLYLDSKNIHLQHIFKGEIQAAIKELEEADKYGREKARNEIEERRQVSWMKDLKRAIEIIVNVVNLKKTLAEYVIEGNIEETTTDFKKYLSNYNLDDLNKEGFLKIYEWFEEEYRPQVIMNNLFKPLKNLNKLSREYYSKIKEFENACKEFETHIKQNQYQDLDPKLLQDISEFIKNSQEIISHIEIIA